MRTILLALLVTTAAACVDIQHKPYMAPDGGTGSAAFDCTDATLLTGDLPLLLANATDTLDSVPASGSWKLSGKLTLSGAGVTSLAKLGQLCSVADLEIANTGLTKIDSLGPIQVAGNVSIHDNANLADADNVTASDSRIDSLDVEHNAMLGKLDGFASLQFVTNATVIRYNQKLATVDLHAAQRLEGGLDVEYNDSLTSLQLAGLQSVADLTLSHNATLPSVTLGALQFVHGSLTIDTNAMLDLGTMMTQAIDRVDLNLVVTNNAALANIGQLAHMQSVGGLIEINGNTHLDYCPAREVGCCVAHTGAATITNNMTSQCNTGHSWCYSQNQNACPYQY